MAIYAGETVRIYSTALDWDNENVLSPSTVEAVTLTITRSDTGEVVAREVPMVWNQEEVRWLYEWSAVTRPGVYRLEVTYLTGSGKSKESKTLKLS